MNAKKCKQLRRLAKLSSSPDETVYAVRSFPNNSYKTQYKVHECKREVYRSMKKALKGK